MTDRGQALEAARGRRDGPDAHYCADGHATRRDRDDSDILLPCGCTLSDATPAALADAHGLDVHVCTVGGVMPCTACGLDDTFNTLCTRRLGQRGPTVEAVRALIANAGH